LELHTKAARSGITPVPSLIEIESTDRQIDLLVYELYGLTADEITVVEESVPK
jgi:hypothetical protein